MTWSSCVSDITQKWIEHAFYHFGLRVYNNPKCFLVSGLFLTVICCLGFIEFAFENRMISLWVPTESQIFSNYEKNIDYFGEFDSDLTLMIENTNGDNLLTPENMDIMYDIYLKSINKVSIKHNNKNYNYTDICKRLYSGYAYCISQQSGLLSLFEFNSTLWQTQDLIQDRLNLYQQVIPVS